MKSGIRPALVLVVLALLAALPLATAQEAAQQEAAGTTAGESGPLGPLERYELALDNLDAAIAALPADPARAREELLRAEGALRVVADGDGGTLITDLERVVDRAEVAIENRSRNDLAIRAAVIEGGLRRLLFDGALRAAAGGGLDEARARVARLVQDIGAPEGASAAVANAADAAALRAAYAEAVANAATERIERAPGVRAEAGVEEAYVLLATAYGDLVAVRGADGAGAHVVTAISALVEGDGATFEQEISAAVEALEAYAADVPAAVAAEAAAEAPAAATAEPATAEPTTAEPAAEPIAAEPATAEPVAAEPVAVPSTAPGTAVADGAPAETDEAGLAVLPGTAGNAAGSAAENGAETEAEDAAEIEALAAELRGHGLSSPRAASMADTMTANGFPTLDRAFDALYAASARALVAIEAGDLASARVGVAEAGDLWRTYLQPVARSSAPALANDADRLLNGLSAASSLRLQDLATLLAHVDALHDALQGESAPALHGAVVDATLLWAGVPRLVVLILLGLFATVPLVLLNLAFGGGNRNWQLIGVALFLLLLPVIFEGLGYALALLADLTGVAALDALTRWSIFQNTISQIAWAVVTAAAIGFATAGLYGICVQFGLIGRRAPDVRRTQPGIRTAAASETGDDTLVDWDEEF